MGCSIHSVPCIAVSLHISVGFCVAYPYLVGNAKTWNRGISNRYRFPRFFFLNTDGTTRFGESTRLFVDIKGMRCNNCGWTNPEGLSKCQKCNQTLSASEPLTAPEVVVPTLKNDEPVGRCSKCGYPLAEGADYCPNCGSRKIEMPKVEAPKEISVQNRKTVVLDSPSNIQVEEVAKADPEIEQPVVVESVVKEPVVENYSVVEAPKEELSKPCEKSMSRTVVDFPHKNSSAQDTRKTVVDSTEYISDKKEALPRETVADFSEKIEPKVDAKAASFQYKLSCIDGRATMDVVLQASSELPLKQGEVVLIGGLRYRAD